ncbi:pentapeptide repeat-containing protein [Rhodococcus rhodochrous]|nr:pentapeptide repeat-containing protein [Rhodococcus rhodochrous]MCQ4134976.1 pentapeptide repeat-containing protein [Rhodococcus rhodochrous]
MFSAFAVAKELHEMMWHLLEAQQRTYDPDIADAARELVESLATLTRRSVDELESLGIGEIRASVRPVLLEVSAEVRASYFADDAPMHPDLVPGADLAGTDLRGHRLCGADLRNALLIGADLRGCDLAGVDLLGADLRGARVEDADLSLALYVTGPQLAAAHGNRRTRVPAGVPVPRSRPGE